MFIGTAPSPYWHTLICIGTAPRPLQELRTRSFCLCVPVWRQVVGVEGSTGGARISLAPHDPSSRAAYLRDFQTRALKVKPSGSQQQLLYTTDWRKQIDRGSSSAGASGGETSLLILGVSAGSSARRS